MAITIYDVTYKQATDEEGNPVVDENGKPVMVEDTRTVATETFYFSLADYVAACEAATDDAALQAVLPVVKALSNYAIAAEYYKVIGVTE